MTFINPQRPLHVPLQCVAGALMYLLKQIDVTANGLIATNTLNIKPSVDSQLTVLC